MEEGNHPVATNWADWAISKAQSTGHLQRALIAPYRASRAGEPPILAATEDPTAYQRAYPSVAALVTVARASSHKSRMHPVCSTNKCQPGISQTRQSNAAIAAPAGSLAAAAGAPGG